MHGASPPPATMARTRLQHAQLCTHGLGTSVWPPGEEILQISDLPLHPTTCKSQLLCEEQEACLGARCSGDGNLMSSLLAPHSALQGIFMVQGMYGVALHKKGQSNPSALSSRIFFFFSIGCQTPYPSMLQSVWVGMISNLKQRGRKALKNSPCTENTSWGQPT